MRRRIEAAENGVRDKRQVGQRRIVEARRACARMIARVEDEQRAPEGARVVTCKLASARLTPGRPPARIWCPDSEAAFYVHNLRSH